MMFTDDMFLGHGNTYVLEGPLNVKERYWKKLIENK